MLKLVWFKKLQVIYLIEIQDVKFLVAKSGKKMPPKTAFGGKDIFSHNVGM